MYTTNKEKGKEVPIGTNAEQGSKDVWTQIHSIDALTSKAKVRGIQIHQKQKASGSGGLGWGSREKTVVYKVNSLSPKALCLNSQ